MIEAIESFLVSINPSFGVFAVSLIPVIELRGAIPLGIGLGLNWFWVYIISVIGNLLPVPFVILLIRPFINWLAGSKEEANRWIKKLKGKEKVLLFFMFLLPLFPDDLLCSLAGVLPITFLEFLLMQGITRATTIGGTLLFASGEIIPLKGWGLYLLGTLLVIIIVLFIMALKNADKINKKMDKLLKRFNKNN